MEWAGPREWTAGRTTTPLEGSVLLRHGGHWHQAARPASYGTRPRASLADAVRQMRKG